MAGADETYRLHIFYENSLYIKNNTNKHTQLAMNAFGDLTNVEFTSSYMGYSNLKTSSENLHENSQKSPSSVDCRKKGKVSEIKNQGQCGSCWAFSATGALESCSAIFKNKMGDFSEQQLVDCSTSYGNAGCGVGMPDFAFQYAIDKGIAEESDYPYKALDQSCNKDGGDFKISKYTDVTSGDCEALKDAVAQQPVSVGVDAEEWQFYSGGILSNCGTSLDHGVLVVGYEDQQYWIVKNSWGNNWGEIGFIRLNFGNTCGVCNSPSYPSI